MNHIYPSTYFTGYLDTVSDLFKHCAAGDIVKVRSLLNQNENIYEEIGNGLNIVPMFIALNSKNVEVVNILLDIYERDLEALKELTCKKALIALPEDQTDELMSTVQFEASDDLGDGFIPVLLKSNNNEVPECVFLRKKLKNRSDLSLRLAKKLRKNGLCDLNWQVHINALEDSFLHLAIHHQMISVINRLLSHPTVQNQIKTSSNHTPLHYAMFTGKVDIANLLLSTSDYGRFFDDPSYLYQAALSGKQRVVDFMIEKMLENGKSMKEILEIPFAREDYSEVTTVEYLLHVLIKNGSNLEFLEKSGTKLDERDICKQNSNGETVLHLLVISSCKKLNPTINLITDLAERYPKLLLIVNKDRQLPLHYAAFYCTRGMRLYQHLLKLTVEASGDPDIFFVDPEVAIATLEKAIVLNNSLTGDYLKHFEKLLKSHGTRLLHKIIRSDMKLKTLKEILSSSVKLNPNEFYEGRNAFLLLNNDIESLVRSKCGKENRIKMLNDYHKIEDPNAKDTTGTTLFMYIVGFCKDNDFIRSLINVGADCRAKNLEDMTCLHHAASNSKNKEILQLMLDNGADPSALTASNKLAIHYAILDETLEHVEVLLPLLSDDQLRSKFGKLNETLIQTSMTSFNAEILKAVWDCYDERKIKVDVNSTNDDGDNPLLTALSSGNTQNLELLFSKSFDEIDFNHKNNEGETFTHKAAISLQVVSMFKCKMFDKFPTLHQIINDQMSLKNLKGDSPMDQIAAYYQYQTAPEDDIFDFFPEVLNLDNLRTNFYQFFKCPLMIQTLIKTFPDFLDNLEMETYYKILESASCDIETNFFIFEKLSSLLNKVHDSQGRTILHLVCERNDLHVIDYILKMLTEEAFENLAKRIDSAGKTAFSCLSTDNQSILEKCFS